MVKHHSIVEKNDPGGRTPLKTREDAQHIVEDRLAALPPMVDSERRRNLHLEHGWWTLEVRAASRAAGSAALSSDFAESVRPSPPWTVPQYWTASHWEAFLQQILFVVAADDLLLADDQVRTAVAFAHGALFSVYRLVKSQPETWTTEYLDLLGGCVADARDGLAELMALLECGSTAAAHARYAKGGTFDAGKGTRTRGIACENAGAREGGGWRRDARTSASGAQSSGRGLHAARAADLPTSPPAHACESAETPRSTGSSGRRAQTRRRATRLGAGHFKCS